MNGIMIYPFDDYVVDLLYDLTSITTIPEKKKQISKHEKKNCKMKHKVQRNYNYNKQK